jgi:MarR family transcriptional regulator, transcriptional regulator for hemolysin
MLMNAGGLQISFMMNDLVRSVRQRFDNRARALGVTRPQWRVLLTLSRNEGLSQAALADRLEVERISLCRMVDRMAEAGLVERRADPDDRRVWRIHPTAKARDITERLTEIGAEIESEMLQPLSPAETDQLRHMLQTMRQGFAAPPVQEETASMSDAR